MSRYMAVFLGLVLVHSAVGVDRIRLWLSPEPPTPGWFVSTAATDEPLPSSATVTRQGTPEDVPAPSQPAAAPDGLPAVAGEAYYVWARFDAPSQEGRRIFGMNLQVLTTADLTVSYTWYNWRRPATGSPTLVRWELGSDLEGPEVQFVGIAAMARGWLNEPTVDPGGDRLDAYPIAPTIDDPIQGTLGQGAILLGKIGWLDGVGDLMLRLGSNGLASVVGTEAAFGTGDTFIDGGVGPTGRGYGIQGRFIPEPATLGLLAAGLALLRRRAG